PYSRKPSTRNSEYKHVHVHIARNASKEMTVFPKNRAHISESKHDARKIPQDLQKQLAATPAVSFIRDEQERLLALGEKTLAPFQLHGRLSSLSELSRSRLSAAEGFGDGGSDLLIALEGLVFPLVLL
ncbi:unnamed protein product, partial [Ectocarpus sp. 13 AM-2016]